MARWAQLLELPMKRIEGKWSTCNRRVSLRSPNQRFSQSWGRTHQPSGCHVALNVDVSWSRHSRASKKMEAYFYLPDLLLMTTGAWHQSPRGQSMPPLLYTALTCKLHLLFSVQDSLYMLGGPFCSNHSVWYRSTP